MTRFYSRYTAHVIKIDLDLCKSCKKCYNACFVDVIRWDAKAKKPFAKYPEECATCNWCEMVCEEHAIEVIPRNPWRMPEPYPKEAYPLSYVEK